MNGNEIKTCRIIHHKKDFAFAKSFYAKNARTEKNLCGINQKQRGLSDFSKKNVLLSIFFLNFQTENFSIQLSFSDAYCLSPHRSSARSYSATV